MREAKHNFSIDRITIAFHAPGAENEAVNAATTLAASFDAEVSGVFIEDLEMLRAAQLPIALELCRTTNLIRPVISSELEHALKTRAAAARRTLSTSAGKIGTKWTFNIVRQHIASTILELAKAADVTIYAIDATAPQWAAAVTAPFTVARSNRNTIVVFLDDSPAAKRALAVAESLSETLGISIIPIVIATTKADSEQIHRLLEDSDESISRKVQLIQGPQFDTLVNAARTHQPAVVVLPISLLNDASQRIVELEATLGRSIVIVR